MEPGRKVGGELKGCQGRVERSAQKASTGTVPLLPSTEGDKQWHQCHEHSGIQDTVQEDK